MNSYETGKQKIIPAVLLYAFYEGRILMLNGLGKDGSPGKWNGLGGKLEVGESMSEAAVREFREEAQCETNAQEWQWLGQLFFPNFKARKNEDWWVNVYAIDLNREQVSQLPLDGRELPEGSLHFICPDKIFELNLWEGDIHFLPFVFSRTLFQGTLFYQDGKCVRHELSALRVATQ